MARIVVLAGDGIGPEIGAAAMKLLDELGGVETDEHLIGGASIDAHGTALTDEVLEECRASDAVLLCAVGGPEWDTTDPDAPRPEQGLLGLRKGLGLYANLRPVKPLPALLDASPLKRDRIEGTDLLVVRELTGGIYFGDSGREGDRAHDDCAYTVQEIDRIARVAFDAAGGRSKRVTSVDKANVLETSRLWRETVERVAGDYPDVGLEHMLRGQRLDAARLAAGGLRRDRDREPVRRHPQRRVGDAHRLARDAALREPGGGRRPRRVRAGPRLRARHRRRRQGQPPGDLPLGRDDAAPRARSRGAMRFASSRRSSARSKMGCGPQTWARGREPARSAPRR